MGACEKAKHFILILLYRIGSNYQDKQSEYAPIKEKGPFWQLQDKEIFALGKFPAG